MGMKDFERPFSMRGITTKIKTPHGSMFITINFYEGQMKEVFVVVSKPGSELRACAEALGRVISLALQKGLPPEDILETLENIKTEEVAWNNFNGHSFSVSSIPDGISKAIKFATSLKFTPDSFQIGNEKTIKNENKIQEKKNLAKKNETNNKKSIEAKSENSDNNLNQKDKKMEICPNCHSSSLVFQEGCFICMNCGYTKCT